MPASAFRGWRVKEGDRIRLQDGWTATVTGVLKNG